MPINIESYCPEHLPGLYAFWNNLGVGIPYFFPVSQERFQVCLFEDRLDGALMYKQLETYLAIVSGRITGFIQFGQPNFSWDEHGKQFPNPAIGNIRHLYFEREFPQVGRALLAQAEHFLEKFPKNHAFFHILGMSCNAYHGKLHENMPHVEALLLENGFQKEHENVYFVLDLEHPSIVGEKGNLHSEEKGIGLEVRLVNTSSGLEYYEAHMSGALIGSAAIRILEDTSGEALNSVYLTWIGLVEGRSGHGLGAVFLRDIIGCLKKRGYRYLHTDTSSANLAAQRFYLKFGFDNMGTTRSYNRIAPRSLP